MKTYTTSYPAFDAPMERSFGYGYPTSDLAKRLGRYDEGCWAAEMREPQNGKRTYVGPYATAEVAALAAAMLWPDVDWSPLTVRYRQSVLEKAGLA